MKRLINFFTKWFKKYPIYNSGSPYVFTYTNNTENTLQGHLFGHDRFIDAPNFGNGDLVVTSATWAPYQYIFKSTKLNPFKINKVRITWSEPDRDFYITNTIFHKHEDSKGVITESPAVPVVMIDLFQYDRNAVDTKLLNKYIDRKSYFEFNVKAKSLVTIVIYPQEVRLVGYVEYKELQNRANKVTYINRNNNSLLLQIYLDIKNLFVKKTNKK